MWFETTPLSHHHKHVTNPVSLPDGAFHIICISRQYYKNNMKGQENPGTIMGIVCKLCDVYYNFIDYLSFLTDFLWCSKYFY